MIKRFVIGMSYFYKDRTDEHYGDYVVYVLDRTDNKILLRGDFGNGYVDTEREIKVIGKSECVEPRGADRIDVSNIFATEPYDDRLF